MENHTIKRARAYYYRDLYQHRARWPKRVRTFAR